jgi:hypothetical protein
VADDHRSGLGVEPQPAVLDRVDHPLDRPVRRTSPLARALVLLVALLLVRGVLAPQVAVGLWLVFAPSVGGLIWLALVVLAGGETLLGMGLEVRYEERLFAPRNAADYRLPDFTVNLGGKTYFWEHLGMLDRDSYARAWRRKREWYERNGFVARLITSADDADGGLSVPEVKARAERRILRGEPRLGEPGFDSSAG